MSSTFARMKLGQAHGGQLTFFEPNSTAGTGTAVLSKHLLFVPKANQDSESEKVMSAGGFWPPYCQGWVGERNRHIGRRHPLEGKIQGPCGGKSDDNTCQLLAVNVIIACGVGQIANVSPLRCKPTQSSDRDSQPHLLLGLNAHRMTIRRKALQR